MESSSRISSSPDVEMDTVSSPDALEPIINSLSLNENTHFKCMSPCVIMCCVLCQISSLSSLEENPENHTIHPTDESQTLQRESDSFFHVQHDIMMDHIRAALQTVFFHMFLMQ